MRSNRKRYALEGWMFVSPWLVGFAAFFLIPMFFSIFLCFNSVDGLMNFRLKWVGLENFNKAVFFDMDFVPLLLESFVSALIYTPAIVFISLIVAIILNTKIWFRGLFRSVFFLPVLIGTGFVMQQLTGQDVAGKTLEMARGLVLPEELVQSLDTELVNIITMVFSNITMILWKTGVQIIIFLAGLQSIPASIYESARVDSATSWEIFWKITMPMMAPITVLNVVYTIVDSFTDIGNPLISYIYTQSQSASNMGFSSAMSWLYLLTVLLLLGIVMLFARRYTDSAYSSKDR